MSDVPREAPPAGEEIHLPGPTLIPITLIVIGTTITWLLSIIGVVILVLVIIRWIGDTRRDIGALPEEHH
jgi:hypothetical protein